MVFILNKLTYRQLIYNSIKRYRRQNKKYKSLNSSSDVLRIWHIWCKFFSFHCSCICLVVVGVCWLVSITRMHRWYLLHFSFPLSDMLFNRILRSIDVSHVFGWDKKKKTRCNRKNLTRLYKQSLYEYSLFILIWFDSIC